MPKESIEFDRLEIEDLLRKAAGFPRGKVTYRFERKERGNPHDPVIWSELVSVKVES